MCEFKPGDEVVCVDASINPFWGQTALVEGSVYIIRRVVNGGCAVHLVELLSAPEQYGRCDRGFIASRFRKVPRRDISQWLETATDYEEPKRKKAKA